jgi:hypothetical protein
MPQMSSNCCYLLHCLIGLGKTKETGRPGRKWEDSIEVDIGVLGWADMDWIYFAYGRDRRRILVNMVN